MGNERAPARERSHADARCATRSTSGSPRARKVSRPLAPSVVRYQSARELALQIAARVFSPAEAYVVLDEYGRTLDLSSAAAARLGTSAERFVGKPLRQRIAPAFRPAFQRSLNTAKGTGIFPVCHFSTRAKVDSDVVFTCSLRKRETFAHGRIFFLLLEERPERNSPEPGSVRRSAGSVR